MRRFSSYGPVNSRLHYHAPRKELIERACSELIGDDPEQGGHYITVWAPRQTGKTWIVQQAMQKIGKLSRFEVCIISMQSATNISADQHMIRMFVDRLESWFDKKFPETNSWADIANLFSKEQFEKPLILILDEFDALGEKFINKFANEFRDIYIGRQNEFDRPTGEKSCLLHGLALIGVRSVLGIENVSGSPFNVQRGLRIPNLTFDEVEGMFRWYERESGQKVEKEVVERLFFETNGQPGLTCWLGELLAETYNKDPKSPIDKDRFEYAFVRAVKALPNNNIVNMIDKADREPYRQVVLDLFRTDAKRQFAFDDKCMNYLYTNGVVDIEESEDGLCVKFSSPFVQKRLFNYFARELAGYAGKLYEPFENLDDTITDSALNMKNLVRRFEKHLKSNREWMLADAPRRKDMRIFEAVFHFNLFVFIQQFLQLRKAKVWPEFPTGNGKVDILVRYGDRTYAVEVKSYTDEAGYKNALDQAARYAKGLGLDEIALVFFVEYVDEANREKYETDCLNEKTGVKVTPVFVATEN